MSIIKYLLVFTLLFNNKDANLVKAKDFEFTLVDGSVKKLSDYEGEVVYLSFWASWCGPCLNNYKKYHEVRTKLEGMGVVLLNISIDENKAKWEKSLDKNIIINGVNAHANDIPFVKSQYQLSSIPLYEILNKKGELVYLTEGYPRDIFGDFDAWLKE